MNNLLFIPKRLIHPRGFVKVYKNRQLMYRGENLVVTTGLNLWAGLVTGTGTPISHMALGESAQAPDLSDTALIGTEHERVAASDAVSAASVTYTATFGAGLVGTVSIAEGGLFNNSVGGTMLARFVMDEFSASSADDILISWAITFI